MNKDSLIDNVRDAFSSRALKVGTTALMVIAGTSACNSVEESTGAQEPSARTLTLDEMGADAGIAGVEIPKIFSCNIDCVSPEDVERFRTEKSNVDNEDVATVCIPGEIVILNQTLQH